MARSPRAQMRRLADVLAPQGRAQGSRSRCAGRERRRPRLRSRGPPRARTAAPTTHLDSSSGSRPLRRYRHSAPATSAETRARFALQERAHSKTVVVVVEVVVMVVVVIVMRVDAPPSPATPRLQSAQRASSSSPLELLEVAGLGCELVGQRALDRLHRGVVEQSSAKGVGVSLPAAFNPLGGADSE